MVKADKCIEETERPPGHAGWGTGTVPVALDISRAQKSWAALCQLGEGHTQGNFWRGLGRGKDGDDLGHESPQVAAEAGLSAQCGWG